jgi:uncharacterized metal-binding protein YceD (DUF177 family)
MDETVKIEFSRMLPLDKVGQTPLTYHVHAEPGELKALGHRFKIVSVDSLDADFVIRKCDAPKSFEIDGTITAQVVQQCIVTLEDVPESLHFPVRLIYRHGIDDLLDSEENDHLVVDEDVDYEDLEGVEEIDLGELTSQYVALALNPYPRSPNAGNVKVSVEEEAVKRPNPFEVLQKLKS